MNRWVSFAVGLGLIAVMGVGIAARAAGSSSPMELLIGSAHNFLASLSEEQKNRTLLPFESDERTNWNFVPLVRKGLPFKEMDPGQALLAHALLNSIVSAKGYHKVTTIMSLDMVLRELEKKAGDARAETRRDPLLYYVTLFGEPPADVETAHKERKPWGIRIEGHHVSLNFTIVGDEIIGSAPEFLGANPHVVPEGPRKGLRVLGAEEDLGRELLHLLNEDQRKQAIIGETAPPDIFTSNKRKAELEGPVRGLPRSAMDEPQKQQLQKLIDEYLDNLPPYVADAKRAKIDALSAEQKDQIHFAWMGATEPGAGNYYRVQAPTFLIEYDNTQNNANHSHTVWRDFDGDFGLDLLAKHHAELAH